MSRLVVGNRPGVAALHDPRRAHRPLPQVGRDGGGARGPVPAPASAAVPRQASRRHGAVRLSRHDVRRLRRLRAHSRPVEPAALGLCGELSGRGTSRHRLDLDGRSRQGRPGRDLRHAGVFRSGLGRASGRRAAPEGELHERGGEPRRSRPCELRAPDHARQPGRRRTCRFTSRRKARSSLPGAGIRDSEPVASSRPSAALPRMSTAGTTTICTRPAPP